MSEQLGNNDAASSVTAELQALSSKRANLKDKLKKRREALGSLLSQVIIQGSNLLDYIPQISYSRFLKLF